MGFSTASYDAVINKIEAGIPKIISDTNSFISAEEHDWGWIPFIGGAIRDGLNKLKGLIQEVLQKLGDYLKPALVPPMMWHAGNVWTTVGSQAGNVSSTIAGQIQAKGNEWQGIAGGKYNNGVPAQQNAANTVSSLAGQVQSACTQISIAGYSFYIAVGIALAGIIGGLVIALATVETGIGAIIGLCVAVAAALAGFAGAVAALYFGVDSAVRNLQGLVGGNGAFPGGNWPLATGQ
jgi:hypothetical protein